MKSIIRIIAILGIALFAITGCSKGSSNPVQPDNTGAAGQPALRMASGRNLLGVYEIHLRSNVSGADVRINRTIQSHVNATAEDYVDVNVDYESPVSAEDINDYNPYFAFRKWVIWRLQITLSTFNKDIPYAVLYDVRGIIMLNNTALGLHNADGLTDFWGYQGGPNPFMYYEDLENDEDKCREYYVQFKPPKPELDCGKCEWPNAFQYSDAVGGKWDPGGYLLEKDQEVWINFAVDASVGGPCQEPYLITTCQTTNVSLFYPTIALGVQPYLHDPINNEVTCVLITNLDIPGYSENQEVHASWGYGNNWEIILNVQEDLKHEAIYHGRIAVTTRCFEPPNVECYVIMYKDIRIFVGDLGQMLCDLFEEPDGDLIQGVKDEWDEREDYIYDTAWSYIDGLPFNPDGLGYIYHLKINYWVWDSQKVLLRQECGLLRICKFSVPFNGLPMMVFCHYGRAACICEGTPPYIDGFPLCNQYKDNFAVLIPRYRGNVLCFDGTTTDEFDDETNSPADWDVDDVLTFLNVVIDLEEEIATEVGFTGDSDKLLDEGKVGIMGGSRGGSPAYLAKIRDSYYLGGQHKINRAIVTMGSVTDFFSQGIATSCGFYLDNDGYVPEGTYHYYLEDYNFFRHILEPYLHGEFPGNNRDEAIWNARKKMLGASPKYFADPYLDYVQVHHGLDDNLCRPMHTMDISGFVGGNSEIHLYPNVGHGIGLGDWDQPHMKQFGNWIYPWYDHIINGD